jgi:DNA mismatch endonuclease (patch repair protein)
MPDIFSNSKRSDVMSRIRSAGNKDTELRLIQIFRANGITGWRRGCVIRGQMSEARLQNGESGRRKTEDRRQQKPFSVRPDFVFPKLKAAVFVDGCFWHGCPRHATQPKTKARFWREKIAGNRARDRRVNRELRKRGWTVVRVWEHELMRKDEARLLRRLVKKLGARGLVGL